MPTFLECSFFFEKALNNCFLAVNAKKHFWPSNICVPYKHKIYQEAKGVKTNLGEIFFSIIHALTAINRFCFFSFARLIYLIHYLTYYDHFYHAL